METCSCCDLTAGFRYTFLRLWLGVRVHQNGWLSAMEEKERRDFSTCVISKDLKGIICRANWLNTVYKSLSEGFFFIYKRDLGIK